MNHSLICPTNWLDKCRLGVQIRAGMTLAQTINTVIVCEAGLAGDLDFQEAVHIAKTLASSANSSEACHRTMETQLQPFSDAKNINIC